MGQYALPHQQRLKQGQVKRMDPEGSPSDVFVDDTPDVGAANNMLDGAESLKSTGRVNVPVK